MPLADETALGLLETHGLVAAIEAADAMLKTAEVRLVSIEQTIPALITIKIVGDVASVQASVDAGRAAAERIGRVVSAHMIPRPAAEVRAMMELDGPRKRKSSASPSASTSPSASASSSTPEQRASAEARPVDQPPDYESMTVRELRAAVRDLPDFPLQGRDVARARKSELLEHLRRRKRS